MKRPGLRPWKGKPDLYLVREPGTWTCKLCPAKGRGGQQDFYDHYLAVHYIAAGYNKEK